MNKDDIFGFLMGVLSGCFLSFWLAYSKIQNIGDSRTLQIQRDAVSLNYAQWGVNTNSLQVEFQWIKK